MENFGFFMTLMTKPKTLYLLIFDLLIYIFFFVAEQRGSIGSSKRGVAQPQRRNAVTVRMVAASGDRNNSVLMERSTSATGRG